MEIWQLAQNHNNLGLCLSLVFNSTEEAAIVCILPSEYDEWKFLLSNAHWTVKFNEQKTLEKFLSEDQLLTFSRQDYKTDVSTMS